MKIYQYICTFAENSAILFQLFRKPEFISPKSRKKPWKKQKFFKITWPTVEPECLQKDRQKDCRQYGPLEFISIGMQQTVLPPHSVAIYSKSLPITCLKDVRLRWMDGWMARWCKFTRSPKTWRVLPENAVATTTTTTNQFRPIQSIQRRGRRYLQVTRHRTTVKKCGTFRRSVRNYHPTGQKRSAQECARHLDSICIEISSISNLIATRLTNRTAFVG